MFWERTVSYTKRNRKVVISLSTDDPTTAILAVECAQGRWELPYAEFRETLRGTGVDSGFTFPRGCVRPAFSPDLFGYALRYIAQGNQVLQWAGDTLQHGE